MAYKPYYKRNLWEADERTQAQHRRLLDALTFNTKSSSSGMFELTNLKLVSYNGGYQVMFWNDGDNYSPKEYADVVNDFLPYVPDHKANATKINGEARISFHVSSKRAALRLARKYLQDTIWDWANQEELSTKRRIR